MIILHEHPKLAKKYEFYKKNENNKIWEVDDGTIGPKMISFDKDKIYNLWTDYPKEFSEEELKIFDEEMPFWRDFFKDRR